MTDKKRLEHTTESGPAVLRVAIWMIAAACGYAAMIGVVKHLSADMNIYVVIFWRYFLALVVMIPWLLPSGGSVLKTQRLGMHIWRALLMVVHGGTLMLAIMLIPLAEATSLIFTSPLFATVLAAIFLHEVVGPRRWLALTIGFVGVLVILRPGIVAFDLASGLMLVSAFTGACVVVTGKILLRSESSELTVFYLTLFAAPFALLPALYHWEWPSLEMLPWLVALALVGNAYIYGLTRALKIAETSMVMPFDFLRMPAAAVAGYILFAETIDVWSWVGAAIVFAATIYITRHEMTAARKAPEPPNA
jgi:drug/metabolite transporter (DMT)-like permease